MTSGIADNVTESPARSEKHPLPLKVVVASPFIAPHKLPIWQELAGRVERLTLLLSTEMEPNRRWQAESGGLDVRIQKTTTFTLPWRHKHGFTDPCYVHIPRRMIRELRELAPDVVISGELGIRSLFSSVYRALFPRTKLIFWCAVAESTEIGRGMARYMLRRSILGRADRLLTNSNSGRCYLQRMGVPAERIDRVVYPTTQGFYERGCDTRPQSAAHRLLFVGQLIERKGLLPFAAALIRWAERHPERAIEFTLIGSGPLESKLRALKSQANLKIDLLGQCDYEAIIHAHAQAGIFAFPTMADDWGMAACEAMASGLPVLGSIYSQAVNELCEEGVTGWRFRVSDAGEMDRALDAALNTSPEDLNAMRSAARRQVSGLTPEHTVDQVLESIRKAFDRGLQPTVERATPQNASDSVIDTLRQQP